MVIKLNSSNYDEIINGNKKVLVDFYADWCGPCKMMGPIVDAFSEENADVAVAKVNVDEEMELAMKNSVSSIPTLVVFEDGKVARRSVGALSKTELVSFVKGE